MGLKEHGCFILYTRRVWHTMIWDQCTVKVHRCGLICRCNLSSQYECLCVVSFFVKLQIVYLHNKCVERRKVLTMPQTFIVFFSYIYQYSIHLLRFITVNFWIEQHRLIWVWSTFYFTQRLQCRIFKECIEVESVSLQTYLVVQMNWNKSHQVCTACQTCVLFAYDFLFHTFYRERQEFDYCEYLTEIRKRSVHTNGKTVDRTVRSLTFHFLHIIKRHIYHDSTKTTE